MSDNIEPSSYEKQFDYEYHVYTRFQIQLWKHMPDVSIERKRRIWQECQRIEEESWSEVDDKFPKQKQERRKYEFSRLPKERDRRKEKDELFNLLFKKKLEEKFRETFEWSFIRSLLNVLRCVSSGILFVDRRSKKLLVVQNRNGTYSAPKGHPKWKHGKLESLLQTAKRETREEVSITRLKTKEAQTKKIFCTLVKSGTLGCVETVLSDNRLIRLYIAAINEEDFSFKVDDENENSKCVWLNWDEILRNKIGEHDCYYTLTPFIPVIERILPDNRQMVPDDTLIINLAKFYNSYNSYNSQHIKEMVENLIEYDHKCQPIRNINGNISALSIRLYDNLRCLVLSCKNQGQIHGERKFLNINKI